MRFIFNFPDIGEGLDEGTIAEWYVEKGQQIKAGDPLVKMETDKVVTDIPSPKSGTIAAKYGKVGETIHVGSPLVEIELEGIFGEKAIEEAQKTEIEAVEEEGAGVVGTLEIAGKNAYLPASVEGVGSPTPDPMKPQRKAIATPVARAMAKDLGVDINEITGTGPGGRVTTEDVKKFRESFKSVQSQSRAAEVPDTGERVRIVPLSQIRKAIARNMITSKQNAAHMTVHDEAEVDMLYMVREKYKIDYERMGVKLSYLPFILKATALALKKFPSLNSQMDIENDKMIYKNYYNIGIAIDTEEGLVVPVIHDVDKLSVLDIARRVNELINKARERKLTMEDMKDGTFTITNYGSIGGIHAVPVINYPQAGILGIGRLLRKPVVRGERVESAWVMPFSLSVDHRIVDGGDVARFLNQVMSYLADPVSMIME